jgi:vitamin B12/bleomycin/antimicrobial peptide transport system ATP-binding/permease protein
METQRIPLKVTGARLVRVIRIFLSSEAGWTAKWMFAALVALLCAANGLNVVNSYVNRNFMTAIADRNMAGFIRLATFSVGVFAASTVVAVIAKFAEDRLGLLWREAITRRALKLYLADGAYDRLAASDELPNPDQRISEDVHTFSVTALSFILMALNSALTILAFSGVLWTINPLLAAVAAAYAAVGSVITLRLGRPLVRLNSDQLDKEASFRSALIHVRENAESIRLARAEVGQEARLISRLDDLVANFRHMVAINRNVGFFSTGYNWLIQIIPALIIAPAFIRGEIEFGVITQSAIAFSTVVAAFSLVVTQYQSISNFAAVAARLNSLMTALEAPAKSPIEIVEGDGRLAYEGLTLSSPTGAPLVKQLSISMPLGARVRVAGQNPAIGTALFKATAGLSIAGVGRIVRPADMQFLAERPYLPPGTLRQALAPGREAEPLDERISELLRALKVEEAVAQAGGLDCEQDWMKVLSLRDQQLLALVRLFLASPGLAFLDRIFGALGPEDVDVILRIMAERLIAFVSHEQAEGPSEHYDAVLECSESGEWSWKVNRPGGASAADTHTDESRSGGARQAARGEGEMRGSPE